MDFLQAHRAERPVILTCRIQPIHAIFPQALRGRATMDDYKTGMECRTRPRSEKSAVWVSALIAPSRNHWENGEEPIEPDRPEFDAHVMPPLLPRYLPGRGCLGS